MVNARDVRSDDLRYLAALADSGRLITAAKVLGVDHSTVSRRLHALENALGIRVLNRGDDGWVLTDAGRDLLEHARAVQRSVESVAQYAAASRPGNAAGTVRVTAADGFGTTFVVPALARAQREHPELNVELVTGARELTLQAGSFDIAVTLGPTSPTRLYVERLCEYDSAFYGTTEYFEEHGNPTTLEELQAHRLVFFIDAMQRIRELDLADHVEKPRIAFSSTNIFAQLAAVRAGAGIGLISKFMARTMSDLHPIAAELTLPRVPVSIAVREDTMRRPAIAVVREALHREVRSRRAELVWATSVDDLRSATA